MLPLLCFTPDAVFLDFKASSLFVKTDSLSFWLNGDIILSQEKEKKLINWEQFACCHFSTCVAPLVCPLITWKIVTDDTPSFFRHLDISQESRRISKFKMTKKILTAIVQRLVHLMSLDISGHIMLDNCTVPHFEEAMGRPRWVTMSWGWNLPLLTLRW